MTFRPSIEVWTRFSFFLVKQSMCLRLFAFLIS
jgi:hypothetical protein